MDWKIELLPIPVTDVERAKTFYVDKLGFNTDHDLPFDHDGRKGRFVQLTPPGSACSVVLDVDMTPMKPGQMQGIQCVVDDADTALGQLRSAGVEADGVHDLPWGRFVFFTDPDGNSWALQEIPSRR